MKNENISGIGSSHGGEMESLTVEGIGKLKRKADIKRLSVEGVFKSKGKFTADVFNIEGVARVFRDVKAKNVNIEGVLKMRRASLHAEKITCDGIIVSNNEISADELYVDGVCSADKIFGDKITIINKQNGLTESKIPTKYMFLTKLYFGRELSLSHSLADVIECTELVASGLKCKTVRAGSVNLSDNCIIEKLYCDGEIITDDSCEIGEIISKNNNPNIKKGGKTDMANANLVKILDMYKNGAINADEAEKMIGSISEVKSQVNHSSSASELLWADDGKLRIVAFIGRKLLKKGEEGSKSMDVTYTGAALNVECYGSLHCGDVSGNASAGGSINAGKIGGNVSCGGSINCSSVGGNCSAGGGVHINR